VGAETLDGASEKLEKLMAMKSRADLLAKLAQMDSRELRIILLACVLQQQREHGRTGHWRRTHHSPSSNPGLAGRCSGLGRSARQPAPFSRDARVSPTKRDGPSCNPGRQVSGARLQTAANNLLDLPRY